MNSSISVRLAHALAATVITLTAILAYSNTFHSPFVFDDIPNISENPNIQVDQLTWAQLWRASFHSPLRGRPVSYLTFALNHAAGGPDAWSFHVTNLGIHVLAGILAYWLSLLLLGQASKVDDPLLSRLPVDGKYFASLLAALVFTLHPLQTQSVTYVVQRMTSLAALFYLAAFACYVSGRISPGVARRWSLWTLGLLLWLLALGSKQISVTLPIVIMLYEWYFHENLTAAWLRRHLVGILSAILLIALVSTIHLLLVGDKVFDQFESRDFTLTERLLTQTRVVCIYAGLTFFPSPSRLNLLHDVSVSRGLTDPWTTALSLTAVLLYLALAVTSARWSKLFSFCLLWPVIHLAIESSILPIELIYEHRMYLPLFGISFLVGIAIASLVPTGKRWVGWTMVLVMAAILGAATHARNETWKDPVELWTDVARKSPAVPRAYLNRGGAHAARREWDLAIADFSHAIQLRPEGASFMGRGMALREMGRVQDAIADFTAAASYAETAEIEALALRNRGAAWAFLGNDLKAIEDYSRAIHKWPEDINSRFNRANANRRRGEYRLAIADYRECLRLNPNSVQAINNLAALHAECPDPSLRNPRLAIQYAQRACELTGYREWQFLDTLASSHAAAGDYLAASRWQATAVDLAPDRFKENLRSRLDQYLSRSKN